MDLPRASRGGAPRALGRNDAQLEVRQTDEALMRRCTVRICSDTDMVHLPLLSDFRRPCGASRPALRYDVELSNAPLLPYRDHRRNRAQNCNWHQASNLISVKLLTVQAPAA